MNDDAKRFWDAYVESLEPDARPVRPVVTASMAGDERVADALLQLYLDGTKHAGSGLVEEYTQTGEALPRVGDYWIILDAKQAPRCIVRTSRVLTHPFRDVPEEIAIAEGEGDLSLAYWRQAHRWFYAPYLECLGIDDLEQALVLTELFDVVYRPTEHDSG